MALSTSSEGSPLIASAPVAFNPLRFEWTPRAALDYLPGDRVVFPAGRMPSRAVTQPLSNPLPAARPESVIAKPHSVVSAGALSPSLVSRSFEQGVAGDYAWDDLVAAGVFENDPLHGSVYKRKGSVKYIILHSTETANPADARRVILSWNNRGLKHPGAQFVVDRDGTICSTTDPDMVVIHIEPSRALAGYSNDNSIGIEIVRSGKQEYTKPQLDSVNRLVAYLQSHYSIPNSNVTTHHHVQPSDRSDPVNFDMLAFESEKSALQTAAIAYKSNYPNHSAQLLQIARAKRERALAAATAAAAARVAAANAAAARAAAANAATIVADEDASTADGATAAAAARRSDDLDDVLFPVEPESVPVKSSADSTQYVSTMPKSAPDFRRRNKELILRD